MNIFIRFIILLSLVVLCNCDGCTSNCVKRRPHHHHYDYYTLLYGGGALYYITFLVIKAKIIFIIGVVIAAVLFSGKLFALLKFAEFKKYEHHEPEKVYVESPHHDHHDHHDFDSAPFGSSHRIVYAAPPPGFINNFQSGPPNVGRINQYHSLQSNQLYNGGRSSDSVFDWKKYYNFIKSFLKKINSTNYAFKSMKLTSDDCRKKFVCEMDFMAKNNKFLRYALNILKDEEYHQYQTNKTMDILQSCQQLYPNCKLS